MCTLDLQKTRLTSRSGVSPRVVAQSRDYETHEERDGSAFMTERFAWYLSKVLVGDNYGPCFKEKISFEKGSGSRKYAIKQNPLFLIPSEYQHGTYRAS